MSLNNRIQAEFHTVLSSKKNLKSQIVNNNLVNSSIHKTDKYISIDSNNDGNKEEYLDENYGPNGKLIFKEHYKDKNSDGIYEKYLLLIYGTNGKLSLQTSSTDSNSDGNNEKYSFKKYNDDGKLFCQEAYKDSNSDGNKEEYFHQEYNDDGQLLSKVNIKDYNSDGVYEEYLKVTPRTTEQYKKNKHKTFTYYSLKERCSEGITIDSKLKGNTIYNIVNIPSCNEKTEIKVDVKSRYKLFNSALDKNLTGEIKDTDNGLIFKSSINSASVKNPFQKESDLRILTVERFGQTTLYESSKNSVTTKDKQGNILGQTHISGSIITYKINDTTGSIDLNKLVPQHDLNRGKILELLKSQPANILKIIDKTGLQSVYSSNQHAEVPNAGYENKKIVLTGSFDEHTFLHELGHAVDDWLLDEDNKTTYASNDKASEIYALISTEKNHTAISKQELNDHIYNPGLSENKELFAEAFALSHTRFLTQEDYTIERYSAMDDLKDLGGKLNKIVEEKLKTK